MEVICSREERQQLGGKFIAGKCCPNFAGCMKVWARKAIVGDLERRRIHGIAGSVEEGDPQLHFDGRYRLRYRIVEAQVRSGQDC